MEKSVKFRNHFFIVIESLCKIWIVFLWLILQFVSDEPLKKNVWDIAITTAIIVIDFFLSLFIWRKTTYVFDENALVVEKNAFVKKKQTIVMSNITTVNINRTILQAIFGVRLVKVDTNSSVSTDSEVKIYLSKKDAIEFQKTIMEFVSGNKEETAESVENTEIVNENTEDKEEKKSKVKNTSQASFEEIFFHCIFTLKIVQIVIFALSFGSAVLTSADLDEGESAGGVMSIITAAILIVGIIISFLQSFFAYHKLEAVRSENELNISYGFFDYKTFRIPVEKIVSVKVKEPMLGRLFKKAYAEIVCVGMGDEEKELSLLSLCTSKRLLAAKLHMLLPEFVPEEVKNAQEFYRIKGESKKGLCVRVLGSLFFVICTVIGVIIGIVIAGGDLTDMIGIFAIVTCIICLIIVLYGICKNKSCGYSVDDKYFRITTGAFNKETNIIPYKGIEHITINKSPVYKIWKLAKMNVATKSGTIIGMITGTGYVEDDDIEIIREKYKKSYIR